LTCKIKQGLEKKTPIKKLRGYTLWYWRHHIKPHFFQEEKILIPHMPSDHPRAIRLKEEHDHIRELILGLDDEVDKRKSKIYSKKDSISKYNNKYEHWRGIELGVNVLLDYKNTLNTPKNGTFLELDYAKSIQFGMNLFEKDFHLYENYINLVTGIGFDFNHYTFKNNITLNPDTSYLTATADVIDYKKNKLNVSYLKVPLLLEINTSKDPEKNFHIAAGMEFAYRIHSVTKQKYDIGDKHYRNKTRDDYNLEPFRYGLLARIGYNNVTIFANYSLNRLFQKDKGPQVYPFTVGLSFNRF